MNEPKFPSYRPPRVDDFTPLSIDDVIEPTPANVLRLKVAEAQAKANSLDRLNAALWQREQDRRAREQEAAAERRRKGR